MKCTAKTHRRKAAARAPAKNGHAGIRYVAISSIKASPENDALYRPVDPTDPEIVKLGDSIGEHGILEPLIVTADGYIVSGHRRHVGAKLAGLETVPVRRLSIRRADDLDTFVRLLREHNRQRDKTNAEKLREEIVSVSGDEAHAELWKYRREKAAISAAPLELEHGQVRCAITSAKQPLLRAVQAVIESRREFWPLSDRTIHYALLNDPPLIHASKPKSLYRNDKASYRATVDILTRGRTEGRIPFDAIGDETRPVQVWDVHQSVRAFTRRELAGMFRGYWRDLLQSQPNHIELIGEKNTIGPILRPIATEYTIPLTTGRGYCSLAPRHAMAQRFKASGKEKLVLLIVSDFDPEGEDIAHGFARSMRDDFHIDAIHPIKVALTAEQMKEQKLPTDLEAKKTSSRYRKFVDRHGVAVAELEALPPETLQQIVRSAIEGVIDRPAFAAEIAAEREDAAFLAGVRRTVTEALQGIDLEGGDDE
jgi:hypothetical protein